MTRRERTEYQSYKSGYYHLVTNGWHKGKLFHNAAQFAYGMIIMGLLTLRFGVVIYAFTLMDNHIHIILSGTGEECVKAFDYLRKKISARLVKDGYSPLPADYGFKLVPIENEEQMRSLFIYVARNAYERQLCIPGGYPWGSDYMHYSLFKVYLTGVPASSLSKRELERLTCSDISIPNYWQFHPELGLLPTSFVNESLFNRLFNGPKDYECRLVKDYESFVQIAESVGESTEFSEGEINEIVYGLVHDMYPGKRLSQLSGDEKGRIVVQLNLRYRLTATQCAFALRIPERIAAQFLRSKDYGKPKTLR